MENSNGGDTNVGNIKEDIKILENWLKELNELFKNTHINNTKERKALEHILSDYKRVLKENEELKEENEYNKILLDMNNNFTIDKKTGNYKWNVIEIQKVKDKIIHYQELQDNYIKKYDEINEGLQAMINALQELIEERKVK